MKLTRFRTGRSVRTFLYVVWSDNLGDVPDVLLCAALECQVSDSVVHNACHLNHDTVHLSHGSVRPHVQHRIQTTNGYPDGIFPHLSSLVHFCLLFMGPLVGNL